MTRDLLKALSPLLSFSRARGYKPQGGVRYPGGITYFPRYAYNIIMPRLKCSNGCGYVKFNCLTGGLINHATTKNSCELCQQTWEIFPDHKDPEYTPSKLFRIERIKPVRGSPWWLKKILKEFHIDEEETVAIVKNIPEINARLWKVKHLIRVTPIVFPYGEPTEEDINYTVLKENGQCLVTKKLDVDQKRIEAYEQFEKDPKKMNSDTLKKDMRNKWMSGWSGGY